MMNGAEYVDEDVRNLIDDDVLPNAALARDDQQHAEEHPDDKRKNARLGEHLKRRLKTGKESVPIRIQVRGNLLNQLLKRFHLQ